MRSDGARAGGVPGGTQPRGRARLRTSPPQYNHSPQTCKSVPCYLALCDLANGRRRARGGTATGAVTRTRRTRTPIHTPTHTVHIIPPAIRRKCSKTGHSSQVLKNWWENTEIPTKCNCCVLSPTVRCGHVGVLVLRGNLYIGAGGQEQDLIRLLMPPRTNSPMQLEEGWFPCPGIV